MRKRLTNTLCAVTIKTRERVDYRSFPCRQVVFHSRIVPVATRSEQLPTGGSGRVPFEPAAFGNRRPVAGGAVTERS